MTPEQITKWAREAGAYFNQDGRPELIHGEKLMAFAAKVAAHEREQCARVCDFEVVRLSAIEEPRPALAAGICAAAIRARK